MKNQFIILLLLIQVTCISKLSAQNVAINSTGNLPDTSAMLDISSTTKGLLAPRMTTAQQTAIPLPAKGLLVFNTTTNTFNMNTGTAAAPVWSSVLTTGGSNWTTLGNTGITQPAAPATYGTSTFGATENFIGTKDAKDLVFGSNNLERMRISNSTGYIGIGTATPSKPLDFVYNLPNNGLMKLQNTAANGYSSIDVWSNTTQIGNIGYSNGGGAYPSLFYFATNTTNGMVFATNNAERLKIDGTNGNVGIGGLATPTAVLHLDAGSATASSAPLKFTSGTNLTTTEAGAVEYNGTHLYFTATNGGTRYQLDQQTFSGGTLAGDVTGPVGTTVVGKINGATLGTTTATPGNMLVANAGNAWTSVAMSGDVTISNTGVTTISANAVDLTTNVTGVLPIAKGGTNSAATPTSGGVGYGTGSAHTYTAAGTTGQILQSAGAASPTWSTATYPATAGTAGNTLKSDGTNFVSTPIVQNMSSLATAKTATTLTPTMMGYGTAAFITPARSGKVLIIISGDMINNTNNDGGQAQIAFGSTATPANGAAAIGITAGVPVKFVSSSITNKIPFSVQAIVTMIVGLPYWIDLQGAAITGGTVTMNDVTITAVEL